MQYNFIKDFHKSRATRIGASDIIKCIPHPEKQIESLAAWTDNNGIRHHETANDLYEEKVFGKKYEYSFPAEMGHFLEGRALYEFIKDNIDRDTAIKFFQGYQTYKMEVGTDNYKKYGNPELFNNTPFKHNTEGIRDWGVAHADCIYNAGVETFEVANGKKVHEITKVDHSIIKKNGLTIDLSKPFIIEAKTARRWTVDARKKDPYKGYDLTLKRWQGVPLATYFQVQYQMYLYEIDTAYISLIFDTSEKHYWQIKKNRKHQEELVTLATYMKTCIDTKTPPKQLVMNSKDIQKLYPEIKDDFREVQGNELTEILEVARIGREAAEKENYWKDIKADATERMSIHLRDTEQLKGIINDTMQTIAKWKATGGGRRMMGLKDIGEREDAKRLLRYLEKNELIKDSEKGRIPNIVVKLDEVRGNGNRAIEK